MMTDYNNLSCCHCYHWSIIFWFYFWLSLKPPKRLSTFKSTVRRRRFEKEETIHEDDEDEEKPSYMNIGFHKKNVPKTATTTSNNNNNHNDKATPSYINLEFHKKEKANAKKKKKEALKEEEEEKGPSYINMEFHKKNEQRGRRRRDDDEDLVEIDFGKMKDLTGNKEEGNIRKDGMKVEMTRENSLSDSDDGYEYPPSSKPRDTRNILKEELGHGPENGTNTNKPHKRPKPDLARLKLPECTDNTAEVTSGNNMFLAIGDYAKESDREVTLQTGTSVQVLEQSEGGWWLVRTHSLSIGWAPSNFLEKISNDELERRKELGLEPPARPPLRPPKSPRVHRMALHVCSEQRFWNFMRKGEQSNGTCSIVDATDCCVDDGGQHQLTVMDVNGNNMQQMDKDIMKDYTCDPETGVCKLNKQDEDHKF